MSPRILRTYDRLNQKTAIQFVDYVLEKLPFEVESIQTDNGSEFQSSFHWHVRRVRRVVPGATEITLGAQDYDSSGKPLIAWDDPVAKAQLVNVLVGDALRLLGTFEGTDQAPMRPPRWACWLSSPAKTSNKTTTAPGRSPSVWPPTGSSRPWTPRPATCASPALLVPRWLQGAHRHRTRDWAGDQGEGHQYLGQPCELGQCRSDTLGSDQSGNSTQVDRESSYRGGI